MGPNEKIKRGQIKLTEAALGRYSESTIGALIHQLKYKKNATALAPIVDTLEDFVRNRWEGLPHVDCAVPAPPSSHRLGLEPAIEITRAVAGRLSLEFIEDAVSKIKLTPVKGIFLGGERRQLLREAIQKGPGEVKDKCVLVIDDVTQTLATLGRVTDVSGTGIKQYPCRWSGIPKR